ncbi:MAG TPA: Dabb family protein [Steroidobacteraceae bacterium]|nr:Dabb family protein [Steroidobacteraceae bacterium]
MLRHYVFIRYAAGTSEEHVAEFCRRMRALRDPIPAIHSLEIGRDILREARSWDVVLIMRFESIEALRTYQQHPLHVGLMLFNQPHVADVAAVDFMDAGGQG